MPLITIIEDDPISHQMLRDLLEEVAPQWEVEGPYTSIKESVEQIQKHRPQLVFLDVELTDGSGFEVLKQLEPIDFDIIVTTSHDKYAIQAIKHRALDYLVKPFQKKDFEEAMSRIGSRLKVEPVKTITPPSAVLQKIAVPTSDGLLFIRTDEIIRLESERNYTDFHLTNNRKVVVTRSLKEYEELLTPLGFFRIHHSHIVNLNQINRYVRGEGGYVILSDGSNVDVSRRRKEEFLSLLSGF
ncbi:MAG: LytR/AlgR family response regulator transcription factor [Bacteroidota bacterium]